jgi:hypothetical protein
MACIKINNEAEAVLHASHQCLGDMYDFCKDMIDPVILWRFFKQHDDNVSVVLNSVCIFLLCFL